MDLTYQQVLADVYEENAKNVLVHQTEYDDEDQPPYDDHDYDANELPDPDDFNKFAGDRGKPEHVIQPPKKPDGLGLASVKKDNIFRTSVINIDGQFRSSIVPSNTFNCDGSPSESNLSASNVQLGTNFSFRTARQYINVYSVEVTSIEFPNSFYTFSQARGNTSFTITYPAYNIVETLNIPDGNYINIVNTATGTPYLPIVAPATTSSPDITTLTGVIQSVINSTFNPAITNVNDKIQINYSAMQHLVYFSNSNTSIGSPSFSITFPSVETNSFGNGLGYNLGFLTQNITSSLQALPPNVVNPTLGLLSQSIIASTFPDTVQDTYIYLKLSDWDLITHQNPNQTSFTAFLKIPLSSPKFTIQYDSNTSNTTSKKYFFHQPTNINLIVLSLLDAYGNIIDLKYSTFSLTIQIQEVLSTATYEQLLGFSE